MFAGTDADNLLDRLDPNLAVSNGTGASSVADDVDNSVDVLIGAHPKPIIAGKIDELIV